MPREISSAFAGNAGEFFVLAELTRRGWTAALTARNTRSYDILAKRHDEFTAVRVKTKTTITDAFQWNAKKDGNIFLDVSQERDFCVLVDIPEEHSLPATYYIVPTLMIDKWLKDDFNAWATTPGARGQQRDATTSRRLFYLDDNTTNSLMGIDRSSLHIKVRGKHSQSESTQSNSSMCSHGRRE